MNRARKLFVVLPLVLFGVFIALGVLPHAVDFMPETRHPWYTSYTTWAFVFCAAAFYPVSFICSHSGVEVPGPLFYLLGFFYSLLWSFGLQRLTHSAEPARRAIRR